MITPEARAKAADARAAMTTKRTTFKGCSGTMLKVGDRVAVSDDKHYRRPGTVVAVYHVNLGDHEYTEVGVHFGAVDPDNLTATEAHAWFNDHELLLRPSVNA